jgi:Uma2 family endonuclease
LQETCARPFTSTHSKREVSMPTALAEKFTKKFADAMPDAAALWSDEPELESSLHYQQLKLLVATLERLWRARQDFFIGANLTVYFSRAALKTRDVRRPDFFLVKGVESRPRRSWVVWEERGRYPDLIIELLSNTTSEIDRTIKKQLYQDTFRTPEYFWFSPDTLEFAGFTLKSGQYQQIEPTAQGWRWSEVLGLYLGVVKGVLRYLTLAGELVPTPEEAEQLALRQSEKELQRAERAAQRAEKEAQRVERLAAKLREVGIDPESI